MTSAQVQRVNHISVSADGSLFTVALSHGVRVFSLDPLVEVVSYGAEVFGSVAICQLLHRTNIMALVGCEDSKLSDKCVSIYDDITAQFVLEFRMSSRVLAIRMRRDRLAVVLSTQIHLFSFPDDCHRLACFHTAPNPHAVCAMSDPHTPLPAAHLPLAHSDLLVFPASVTQQSGYLRLVDLAQTSLRRSASIVTVHAHKSAVVCLSLNTAASLMATASRTGTIIRVWQITRQHPAACHAPPPEIRRARHLSDTDTGARASSHPTPIPTSTHSPPLWGRAPRNLARPQLLVEFRRGFDSALVTDLALSHPVWLPPAPPGGSTTHNTQVTYLSCYSDKNTLHVFRVPTTLAPSVASVAQHRALVSLAHALPQSDSQRCTCVFARQQTLAGCAHVHVLATDGTCSRMLVSDEGTLTRKELSTYADLWCVGDF